LTGNGGDHLGPYWGGLFGLTVSLTNERDLPRALLDRCDSLKSDFVAHRVGWQPHADQECNEPLLAGLRRHGLIK